MVLLAFTFLCHGAHESLSANESASCTREPAKEEEKRYPSLIKRLEFETAFEALAGVADVPFAVVDKGGGLLGDACGVGARGDREGGLLDHHACGCREAMVSEMVLVLVLPFRKIARTSRGTEEHC